MTRCELLANDERMATLTVTEQNFQEIIGRGGIILLDFWAAWCGPCRSFSPIFEEVSETHPKIVFGKVDTESEQQLAAAFEVRSIPTLMVFREGILLFSQGGALPEKALEELIAKVSELDINQVRASIS